MSLIENTYHSSLFDNDFLAISGEAFVVSGAILLLVYGVVYSNYQYPSSTGSPVWPQLSGVALSKHAHSVNKESQGLPKPDDQKRAQPTCLVKRSKSKCPVQGAPYSGEQLWVAYATDFVFRCSYIKR